MYKYIYICIYPTSLHKSDANPTEQSEFWFGCCGFLGKYYACLCVVSDVRSYMYCIGYRHAHMYPTACPASLEIGCYPAQLLWMVSRMWHISKSVWDLHVHTVSGPNLKAHHNFIYLTSFISFSWADASWSTADVDLLSPPTACFVAFHCRPRTAVMNAVVPIGLASHIASHVKLGELWRGKPHREREREQKYISQCPISKV